MDVIQLFTRRVTTGLGLSFLFVVLIATLAHSQHIITVTGKIPSSESGICLSHEHLLVDFIGAKDYTRSRWNEDDAFRKILPFLVQIKSYNVKTFIDCTPVFLGRDVQLLTRLAQASGINLVTNTGLYGGSDHKYLPEYAFTEAAEDLARRWIREYNEGIDNSQVRPGFIKISVNPGPLTELSKKLVTAAAITHKATGLTIASHTGPATPALEELDILKQQGVQPDAFIWVHSQNETALKNFIAIASMGAWVSLDGASENSMPRYIEILSALRKEGLINRILLSHDAGWFDPAKPNGGEFRPFTFIFERMIPAMMAKGFSQQEIDQLLIINPSIAYTVKKRLEK